jgi:hypothetical protein
MATTVSATLIDKVADWLMAQALEDTELEDLVHGCCERLSAAGVPLARANFSFSVLHPLYRAMGFTWRRGEGARGGRLSGICRKGSRPLPEEPVLLPDQQQSGIHAPAARRGRSARFSFARGTARYWPS